MKLKNLMTAVVFGLSLGPVLAAADNNMGSMSGMDTKESAGPVQSRGVITMINTENRKVTLKHEPIPALNWPGMTMGFPVAPEVDLDALESAMRKGHVGAAALDVLPVEPPELDPPAQPTKNRHTLIPITLFIA